MESAIDVLFLLYILFFSLANYSLNEVAPCHRCTLCVCVCVCERESQAAAQGCAGGEEGSRCSCGLMVSLSDDQRCTAEGQ